VLSITEHPTVFNPNAALYDEARKRDWKIVLERKNMIYELNKSNGDYVVTSARPLFNDNHQESLR
jgi:hypothetical protein